MAQGHEGQKSAPARRASGLYGACPSTSARWRKSFWSNALSLALGWTVRMQRAGTLLARCRSTNAPYVSSSFASGSSCLGRVDEVDSAPDLLRSASSGSTGHMDLSPSPCDGTGTATDTTLGPHRREEMQRSESTLPVGDKELLADDQPSTTVENHAREHIAAF